MNTPASSLEIHIHSIDGQVRKFVQKDAEAAQRLLDHIQPGRVFTQRDFMVAGGHSLNVFPSAAVVRIDLVMDGFPEWEFHRGVSDVQEITEAEFRQRYMPEAYEAEVSLAPGTSIIVFGELELANGERVLFEIRTHVEPRLPVEQSLFIQQILSAPSLFARRRGGGAILVNPANIVRLTFHPGPPATPPNALSAEPLPG